MMKAKTVALLVMVSLIFGLIVGGFFGVGTRTLPMPPGNNQFEELKSKFDQLSKVDIEEYLRLKSQKEKYEKADEILGKIILIFLADFRVSHFKDPS